MPTTEQFELVMDLDVEADTKIVDIKKVTNLFFSF
jgi:hypothetical protein